MTASLLVKDHVADLGPIAAVRLPPPLCAKVATRSVATNRNRSDEELSQLGSAGIEELFRRHNDALFRFCLGLTGQADEAGDAMQTVWERALVTFSKRRGAVLKVRPWLYTVARNECLDRRRARGTRQMVDVNEVELAAGLTPEEIREQRAELEMLLSDLAGLSKRQRSALVLREFAGFETEELASELGTSPSRALGLVAEARRVLVERRSGRGLPCSMAQRELTRMRRRSTGVQAHLDSCGDCQYFERRRRGRSLSSLAITPLLFVRGLAERLPGVGAVMPEIAKVAVAATVVAGSVGLAGLPFDRDTRPREAAPRPAAVQPPDASHQRPSPGPRAIATVTSERRHSDSRSAATGEPRTEASALARREPAATPPVPTPATTPAPATATPETPATPATAASPAPRQASRTISLPPATATVDTVAQTLDTDTDTVGSGVDDAATTVAAVSAPVNSATAAAGISQQLLPR